MDLREKVDRIVKDAWKWSEDLFGTLYSGVQFGDKTSVRLNDIPEYGENAEGYADYLEEHLDQRFFPKLSSIDDRLFEVSETINYLQMSPELAEEHKKIYVVDNKPQRGNEDIEKLFDIARFPVINDSKQRLDKFFDFVNFKAIELRSYETKNRVEKIKSLHLNRFVLIGQPGVGKTALMNYLFSINAQEMDDNNVLYLRVHVSSHNKEKYLHLLDKLHYKFLKIFCGRYLYNRSEFNERFIAEFEDHLLAKVNDKKKYRKLSDDEKIDLVIKYIEMMDSIHDDSEDSLDIRFDYEDYEIKLNYARELNEILMEYVQKHREYSYIIVFDGLDSVTIDYVQFTEYKDWIEQIDAVTDNKTSGYKAIYMVTMRDYSFLYFFLNHMKDDRLETRKYVTCSVIPKDLNEILKRKYELAVHRLKDLGYDYSTRQVQNIKTNLMILVYSELHKLSELPVPDNKEDLDEAYFIHFLKLNNGNLRATMRFFRELIIMTFAVWKGSAFDKLITNPDIVKITDEFKGKEWVLFRVLLHGRCRHGAFQNKVRYNSAGCAEISVNNRSLIPNCFNYRDHHTGISNWIPKNLVKIRMIQYLRMQTEATGILDTLKWLQTTFNYNHEDLRHETREMIYNGLLVPNAFERKIIIAEDSGTDYLIELTNMATILLDSLLSESIYYETVVDDTPIQSNFISKMRPISRYDSEIDLKDYLILKSRTVIYFVHYLMQLEKNDIKQYIIANQSDEETYIDDGYHIFTDHLITNIKTTMIQYVHGYLKKKTQKEGSTTVDSFISQWYEEFEIPEDERIQ